MKETTSAAAPSGDITYHDFDDTDEDICLARKLKRLLLFTEE